MYRAPSELTNIEWMLTCVIIQLFFRSSSTQQAVSSVESELPTFFCRPSREKPLEGDIISNSSWATMGRERYDVNLYLHWRRPHNATIALLCLTPTYSGHNIAWPENDITCIFYQFDRDHMILIRITNFRLQLAKFCVSGSWWSLERSNCSTSASQRTAAARDSETG